MRINVYLAKRFGISRREADRLIRAGKVIVNGFPAEVGQDINDEETINSADYIIDIGPKAGIHGGNVVTKGKFTEIIKNNISLTTQYLNKIKKIYVPSKRRKANNGKYEILEKV